MKTTPSPTYEEQRDTILDKVHDFAIGTVSDPGGFSAVIDEAEQAIDALVHQEIRAVLGRLEDNINTNTPITSVQNIGALSNGQYIKVPNMKKAIQKEKDRL